MMDFIQYLAAKIPADKHNIPTLKADEVLTGVLNTVYFSAGAAAIIVIIVGGLMFTTANGDPTNVKRGKNAVLYAVVGLVFVASAFIITNYVVGRF